MRWPRLNPITRKRLQRFRAIKRAWWSFIILATLYGISLLANVISNDQPLLVRFEGRTYFPIFRFYPESTFTDSERHTRPNYKVLRESPAFTDSDRNFMVFPLIQFGPHEIIPPSAIDIPDEVQVVLTREPRVGSLDVNADTQILRANNAYGFFAAERDLDLRNATVSDWIDFDVTLADAIQGRLDNQPMPALARTVKLPGTDQPVELSLSAFAPATRAPRFVRLTLRERLVTGPTSQTFTVDRDLQIKPADHAFWQLIDSATQDIILERAAQRFDGAAPDLMITLADGQYRVRLEKEVVTYPFRPTRAHPLGLDSSGRDVLAQILYALRTSMSFGLLLVFATMLIGIVIGALQGYFGGWLDITGQRLIEIWSALPFLYIIILLGSIYGRSFMLLLICYGVFNWIGISYYIRAEFLKLRKQPFVEAARVMGLRRRAIIFTHILPNALVPIITFFPFSLVSAIGALAALDYLGFGLPATAPSWGALLAQAQEFRYAWWLVLYPALALFIVILLGAFIGEGIRSAYDPRAESKLE